MASLLNQAFQNAKSANRPALLTYTVAGDNTKKRSLEILKSISNYADICELGFPHNTPIADGGQIQTSAYRAIKNGIKINDIFSIAKDFKKTKKTKPIILMGYYNMIFQYNENKFLDKCKNVKVDGLLVAFVTGFCLFLIEFEIPLQIALPTTNPSAFLRYFIVFSVIPNPITTFLDLF